MVKKKTWSWVGPPAIKKTDKWVRLAVTKEKMKTTWGWAEPVNSAKSPRLGCWIEQVEEEGPGHRKSSGNLSLQTERQITGVVVIHEMDEI